MDGDVLHGSFRIDRMDEAMDFAREFGASADDVRAVRDGFDIQVRDFTVLKHDDEGERLVAAIGRMIAGMKGTLAERSTADVIAWLACRGALQSFREGGGDEDQLRSTAAALMSAGGLEDLEDHEKRMLEIALDAGHAPSPGI